jgi:hypothetical protein
MVRYAVETLTSIGYNIALVVKAKFAIRITLGEVVDLHATMHPENSQFHIKVKLGIRTRPATSISLILDEFT